ncbi:hypothetical protein NEOKW01_0893 [Nematocida sp. AWRm80]|nr:hypothetical protein NEOKW01_0893 [Nematocida sp. AWRm80]
MKYLGIEHISKSRERVFYGVANGMVIACENVLECMDGTKIPFDKKIEYAVCDESTVYVVLRDSIITVRKEKVVHKHILEEIEIDRIKRCALSNGRVIIELEDEIVLYTPKTRSIQRYMPFGHSIISVTVDKEAKDIIVLLLESKECNLLRIISVGTPMEEIVQISVPKTVYKVFGVGHHKYILIEPNRISVYNEGISKNSTCFGNPLVLDGCIDKDNNLLLFMFGGEVCVINPNTLKILESYKCTMLVDRVMCLQDSSVIVSNCLGEIGKFNYTAQITMIRTNSGNTILMKHSQEKNREVLHALRYGSEGASIVKIDKGYKIEHLEKKHLTDKPIQILGVNPEFMGLRYQDRTQIHTYNGDINIGSTFSLSLGREGVFWVDSQGLLGQYTVNGCQVSCPLCLQSVPVSYDRKDSTLSSPHIHQKEIVVLSAQSDALGSVILASDTMIYVNHKTQEITELKYREVLFIDLSKETITLTTTDRAILIDRETFQEREIPIESTGVIYLGDNEYLSTTTNGSLEYHHNHSTERLRVGSVIVTGVIRQKDTLVITTTTSALIARRLCNELSIEQAVPPQTHSLDKFSGVFCLLEKGKCAWIEENNRCYLRIGLIPSAPGIIETDNQKYPGEIINFLALDQCIITATAQGRGITKEGKLTPPNTIVLSLMKGTTTYNTLEYTNCTLVDLIQVKEYSLGGFNSSEASFISVLKVDNYQLKELHRITIKKIEIFNLESYHYTVYIGSTHGVGVYSLENIYSNIVFRDHPIDTLCKIDKSILFEMTQCVITKKDLKTNKITMYIDRIKSTSRTISPITSTENILTCCSEESNTIAIVSCDSMAGRILHSLSIPVGITASMNVTLGIRNTSSSVYLLTATGSIIRVVLIDSSFITSALTVDQKQEYSSLYSVISMTHLIDSSSIEQHAYITPVLQLL